MGKTSGGLAGRKPWFGSYPPGRPGEIVPDFTDMLTLFRSTVEAYGSETAVRYFDGTLTFDQLNARSDAFAGHLSANGFSVGDRVALYLQNDPSFLVALLGAWKAGGAAVVMNPMYRHREVEYLLADSGASVLVCLDDLYEDVVVDIIREGRTQLKHVVVSSPRDDQTRDDERVLAADVQLDDVAWLRDITAKTGPVPVSVSPRPEDLAVLMYTSGTTGRPKGAMITHRSLAFGSQVYRDWIDLGPQDRILGVAPLFHITGLVGHVGACLLTGAAVILNHRFEPTVLLESIREHRPTFTVGSITVFNNLSSRPDISTEDFSSLRAVFTGGAPVPPSLRDTVLRRTGMSLHNLYGMTETTSCAIGVPLGNPGRVDPRSGALSVGVPVFNTTVRVIDENRVELPPGEIGEIAISGPQVVPAYWQRPDESAAKIVAGEIATGDIGFMDEDGWFYLIDRKTDMIIASGYKVWPREVEDVLYSHPAVREAAVVGVPDEYRGETVKAFVALSPGSECTAEEIIEFCKSRMAAYKYPRVIQFLNDLPKSAAGKVLRRELRSGAE